MDGSLFIRKYNSLTVFLLSLCNDPTSLGAGLKKKKRKKNELERGGGSRKMLIFTEYDPGHEFQNGLFVCMPFSCRQRTVGK